jgi:hypothetical protein
MSFVEDALRNKAAGTHGLSQGSTPTADSADDAVTPVAPVVEAAPPPEDPRLEALRQELQESKRQRSNDQVRTALEVAASKYGIIDPSVCSTLLGSSIRVSDSGAFEVVTPEGTPRLTSSFTPLSLDQHVKEFADSRPYLVRSEVRSGAGSSYDQYPTFNQQSQYKVEEVFGKGSSSLKASKLMRESPSRYHELRKEAVKRGLLCV